jgi:predicted aminopeptidase
VRNVAFVILLSLAGGCWSGHYLAKQGAGQLQLLRSRRRIGDVLADPSTSPELKRRLKLASAARDFGREVLGLRGGDAFTRFVDSHGAPIAWNVMAARKDALVPHLNRFPVVGAIPYLGFFDERDARREAERLRGQDLDVFVRPVAGYSTLGITADPIYSSMLDGSDARIVEVTLHEMLHSTVYLAGHSDWNESLATVVGVEGAARFFAARGDTTGVAGVAEAARKRERDQDRFAQFLVPVVAELEKLYGTKALSSTDKQAQREPIFSRARQQFLSLFPPAPGKPPGVFAQEPLNNAVILSFTTYHRATPEHRRQLARMGGDLRALVALYRHAVEDEPDPLRYLASLR